MRDKKSSDRNVTGPRTEFGKRQSRRNAQKHSLFSLEVNLSGVGRQELNDLRARLRGALQPDTELLEFLFEMVVMQARRIKVALRGEQVAANESFENVQALENQPDPIHSESGMPLSLGKLQLRSCLRLLDELQEEARSTMSIPPRFEERVVQAFGVDFWNLLTEWNSPSPAFMRLTEVMFKKAELLNEDLPLVASPIRKESREYVAAHAVLCGEVLLKLINMRRQQLQFAFQRSELGQNANTEAAAAARLDLSIRYHTTAVRGFYRALAEYENRKRRPNGGGTARHPSPGDG